MDVPEVSYAKSGDVNIAYQVVGDGPRDLVFVPWAGNLVYAWMWPAWVRFYERLAAFSRLILLDKRGTGLSDRPRVLTLEAQMDDLRAVLDAVGSERASLYGAYAGGQMCALFAATYPDRTEAVVFFNTAARPHPTLGALAERTRAGWGSREFMEARERENNPTLIDEPGYLDWVVAFRRLSMSPGAAYAFTRMLAGTDISDVLPAISAPTLVLHRREMREPALELESRIPNARRLELPGVDAAFYVGDEPVLEAQGFLTEIVDEPVPDSVLATVLFTDVVDSTRLAVELGDREWRELLNAHDSLIRRALVRFRGKEVDTAGDGFFAVFDGPARAIACARAIVEETPTLGLKLRAGVHIGECEMDGERPRGIAVHVGARISASAAPGEVLVSSTVKDLVAGSGIGFEDRGAHELKGVPGEWRLYAVRDA